MSGLDSSRRHRATRRRSPPVLRPGCRCRLSGARRRGAARDGREDDDRRGLQHLAEPGGVPAGPAGQDPALWQKSFNDMVLSLIAITDRVLPGMRQRQWGRIITSTTSGAIAPIKNLAISNTLRAALLAWSKTLATEVARDGITVNVIMPGRIATDRLRQLDEAKAKRDGANYDDVVKQMLKQINLFSHCNSVISRTASVLVRVVNQHNVFLSSKEI